MKFRTIGFMSVLVVAANLVACDVDVEDTGALPDVDVDVQGGRLPDIDVDPMDVDVETTTIEVPVPSGIDIDFPEGEGEVGDGAPPSEDD